MPGSSNLSEEEFIAEAFRWINLNLYAANSVRNHGLETGFDFNVKKESNIAV